MERTWDDGEGKDDSRPINTWRQRALTGEHHHTTRPTGQPAIRNRKVGEARTDIYGEGQRNHGHRLAKRFSLHGKGNQRHRGRITAMTGRGSPPDNDPAPRDGHTNDCH